MAIRIAPWLLVAFTAMTPGVGVAAAADSACADVVFVRSQSWDHSRAVVAELLIKELGEPDFRVRGLLFNGDWGSLQLCTGQFEARIRWMIDPQFPKVFTRKTDDRGTLRINLRSRATAYIAIATSWGEVSRAEAENDIQTLERTSDPRLLARKDLDKDRYGMICNLCSDLRPADAASLRD